jgi:hypothetical protein
MAPAAVMRADPITPTSDQPCSLAMVTVTGPSPVGMMS